MQHHDELPYLDMADWLTDYCNGNAPDHRNRPQLRRDIHQVTERLRTLAVEPYKSDFQCCRQEKAELQQHIENLRERLHRLEEALASSVEVRERPVNS